MKERERKKKCQVKVKTKKRGGIDSPINNHCGKFPVADYFSIIVCLLHSIRYELQLFKNTM
jgi:hypothetical protein